MMRCDTMILRSTLECVEDPLGDLKDAPCIDGFSASNSEPHFNSGWLVGCYEMDWIPKPRHT